MYKKNIYKLFCLLIFLNTNLSFAQLEASYWYFGDSAGLYFDCSGVQVLTNSSMYSFEGSTCISDQYGNLLFYTNAGNAPSLTDSLGAIWNKDHGIKTMK